jgi:hypothetical protein
MHGGGTVVAVDITDELGEVKRIFYRAHTADDYLDTADHSSVKRFGFTDS